MANIPHRTGNLADSVAISNGVTSFFLQVKAIAEAKVEGRFMVHCLGTASNDVKATVWVYRGYGDSAGSSLTPITIEIEDAALTPPITSKDNTTSTPSGTPVIMERVKPFTQGQWLTNEHRIRDGETLTLVIKNEAAGSLNFVAEWIGV